MIDFTPRLDEALMRSAWAHEQAGQHRKGGDIPYISHPYAVTLIAAQFTDDEDILVGSLLHDVLEDVSPEIYNQDDMRREFGGSVVRLVLDNTRDKSELDWHKQTRKYLGHLACHDGAVDDSLVITVADKIHGVFRATIEYQKMGDNIWQEKFGGKTASDKLWVYDSVLEIGRQRNVSGEQLDMLSDNIAKFRRKLIEGGSLEDDVAV